MDTSALSLDGNTRYVNTGQNSSNSYGDTRPNSSVSKGHNYLPASPSQQVTHDTCARNVLVARRAFFLTYLNDHDLLANDGTTSQEQYTI